MARFHDQSGQMSSASFAGQIALSTENTTDAEHFPSPVKLTADEVWASEDFADYSSGGYGAFEQPAPGSRMLGGVQVKGRVDIFKSGFAAGSEEPGDAGVISPALVLIMHALGSNGTNAISGGADVIAGKMGMLRDFATAAVSGAGSTSTTIDVADRSLFRTGELVHAAASVSGAGSTGWIKTRTAGPPDVLTLRSAAAAAAAAGDHVYGAATGYLSAEAPVALTWRKLGHVAQFKDVYIGCVPESLALEIVNGKTPMFEIGYKAARRTRYVTGGGLLNVAPFAPAAPVMGDSSGRLTIDGVDTSYWEELKLRLDWDLLALTGASSSEACAEITRTLKSVALSVTVPRSSGDSLSSGFHQWESAFLAGTAYNFQWKIGSTVGSIFGISIPQMALAAPPKLVNYNGIAAFELSFRPAVYSADDASTYAGNATLAIGGC